MNLHPKNRIWILNAWIVVFGIIGWSGFLDWRPGQASGQVQPALGRAIPIATSQISDTKNSLPVLDAGIDNIAPVSGNQPKLFLKAQRKLDQLEQLLGLPVLWNWTAKEMSMLEALSDNKPAKD